MTYTRKPLLFIAFLTLFAGACKNDEENVAPTDDNEAITTATLTLTNKAVPTEIVTATIDNLNTTADFSKATLTLKANTTYTGVVTLLDKTKPPVLDATAEIREKANEHLFVYTPSTGLNLTATLTDKDTNPAPGPYPIGLTTEMKTGAASSGKLKLVLRHQPATKNGTATPGTTDLDTDFTVVIQ
ncbi:hypothetical protein [Spirosoma linguale]|uniref:Type 1 periplasmic binding fold superfamily protein n=1 Tax=Spirosoma linguale (strain ATCC 33905 / DSM 74 / LMG 10896 / Claus 1) TaxID=504472 RepID=D2QBV5_SPILD|nr:hypothetical protein Slin_1939 [Spirosoma linguale DSM 74]